MSGFGGVNQQGTIPLSSGSFALPVAFGYYPTEGSRIASAQYNFTEQVQYYEDLSFLKQQGMETAVQSVWIDNSNNANAAQITVVGSNQVIIAPPNSQGIIPAFFTEGPGFFITSSAPGITKIVLLNVPCHAANFWSVNSATLALNAEGVQTPKLIGTKAFTVSANAAGATIIIPANISSRFFISGLLVTLDASATITAGADDVIEILDNVTPIFKKNVFIAATGLATTGGIDVFNVQNMEYISQFVGQPLSINLGTGLTTGNFEVSAFGGYTNATP